MIDVQVAQALEQQLGRVEHMMVTRMVITDSQGKVKVAPEIGNDSVEDDCC